MGVPIASAPYEQPTQQPVYGVPQPGFNVDGFSQPQPTPGQVQAPVYGQNYYPPQPQQATYVQQPASPMPEYNQFGGAPQYGGGQGIPQQGFGIFQQPIVQDMAVQYGQRLADQGKEIVSQNLEKYVPVSKLKYYFAVDNRYVLNKLKLLFFPFLHTDWSLKYDHDNPVQPRYDINAPDLYIPLMAYITYVVLAGLVLGMQDRFSPEQLGIQASGALAYTIFELVIYSIVMYVTNIPTTLKTLDLLALAGYKFAIIVFVLMSSILLQKTGYWVALLYCSFSLGFFLLRTLRAKVLAEPVQAATGYDPYGQGGQQNPQFSHQIARKRKLYFLFMVAGVQPLLSFWLTMHLIPSAKEAVVEAM